MPRQQLAPALGAAHGPCQRLGQVQPAAVPALRGGDRDEPGGAEVRLGTVPALRGVAQMGLPGLQGQSLGRRAAMRLRVPAGVLRAAGAAFRGCAERLSQLRSGDGHSSTSIACRSLPRTFPAPGMASPRSGRGRRISPGSSSLTRPRGRAAGWYPPARRSKLGAGWSIPLHRIFRRPGPNCRRACSAQRPWRPRARNVERTDPAAARALYRQSLAIAADLPEALAGLKRTPPDAPTSLDAQVLGDRIRLSWTPPPPDGLGPLTFVVVRKRGGALEHPGDGTRIAEVSTSEFDDMHVTPGDTVGYAVLSKRGSCRVGRRDLTRPVPFPGRREGRPGRIPKSRGRARLVASSRRLRSASDSQTGRSAQEPRDGDRIPAALDHALDRNLDPNEVYHYGIYAHLCDG